MKHFLVSMLPRWLTFGLILTALLPLIGGMVAAGSELFVKERVSKPQHKRNLVLLGSFLSIIGAFVGLMIQGKESYELWAVSTGGYNYCYLFYVLKTSDALKFYVMNNGEYPVYDVSMEIVDLNHWNEIRTQHPEVFRKFESPLTDKLSDELVDWRNQTRVSIGVGNVRPNEQRLVWDAPIPKDDLQRYYVSIVARNGYFGQEILLRRKNDGNFTWASRVWAGSLRSVNGKFKSELLREDFAEDFGHYYPTGIPWTQNLY
jgi:hypothetical protein